MSQQLYHFLVSFCTCSQKQPNQHEHTTKRTANICRVNGWSVRFVRTADVQDGNLRTLLDQSVNAVAGQRRPRQIEPRKRRKYRPDDKSESIRNGIDLRRVPMLNAPYPIRLSGGTARTTNRELDQRTQRVDEPGGIVALTEASDGGTVQVQPLQARTRSRQHQIAEICTRGQAAAK